MKRTGKRYARARKWVHFWYSASHISSVRFLRWCVMRMHTGGKDTNKLGVGAIVSSTWLYTKEMRKQIPHGLRRGQDRLRPYWALYTSYDNARRNRDPIRRPSVAAVRRMEARCPECAGAKTILTIRNHKLQEVPCRHLTHGK